MRRTGSQFHNHVFKMAEHDLTARMGCFLDRHLVFPLLEFLSVKEVGILLNFPFIVSFFLLSLMAKLLRNASFVFYTT